MKKILFSFILLCSSSLALAISPIELLGTLGGATVGSAFGLYRYHQEKKKYSSSQKAHIHKEKPKWYNFVIMSGAIGALIGNRIGKSLVTMKKTSLNNDSFSIPNDIPQNLIVDENSLIDFECPICFGKKGNTFIKLPCNTTHVFCAQCIKEWLTSSDNNSDNDKCPSCRTRIPLVLQKHLKI